MTRRKSVNRGPTEHSSENAEKPVREPRGRRVHPTRARTLARPRDSDTVDNERADDDGMASGGA
jgi:hypothetical protein